MVRYAEDMVNCRRKPLLSYFGESYTTQNCGRCDNCTSEIPLTDITIPAQKLLSCVKRTGERFGAVHVIRVLLGSKDERILQLGHDRLTYGSVPSSN
jgi:ATP-dependent DNA helicase RecQ